MKRLIMLPVVVLALVVPAASLADDSAPATGQREAHPYAALRLEILRLRIQLVHVRHRVVCHDKTSDACAQFTQKIVDRLTTLDQNVQAKLTQSGCGSSSADRKCTVLAKVDAKLQQVIANLGSPATTPSSDESGLDSAANALGGVNG